MPVITPSGLEGLRRRRRDRGPPARVAAPSPGGRRPPPRDPTATPPPGATSPRPAQRILAIAGLDGADGIAGDHQVGSNDWVVAPSKTRRQAALLANDPHLGIGDAVGLVHERPPLPDGQRRPARTTSPASRSRACPAVVLGHNARIAWGATNVDPDVEDLFVETVRPGRPGQLPFRGESVPFEVRHETIKVAGGADVVARRPRRPRHGPILNDVDTRLEGRARSLALRWTATAAVDGTLEAFFKLNTAANFEEFRAAFATYGAPSQNFVYADVDGHIGYVLPGLHPDPRRRRGPGARIRIGQRRQARVDRLRSRARTCRGSSTRRAG